MRLRQRPDDFIVAVLADAQLRQRQDVVPGAEGESVAAAVAEDDLAAGIGEELARVRAAGGVCFCTGGGAVEEVDELDEARAGRNEVADSLLRVWARVEGVAVGRHEDADVAGAVAADVEAGEVHACVWVDDAVPALVGDDSAWAGARSWGWSGHLVEHFQAVMFLLDHLGPGETGPGAGEGAPGFMVGWFGLTGDEEVSEA